jgi:hypothetical protein
MKLNITDLLEKKVETPERLIEMLSEIIVMPDMIPADCPNIRLSAEELALVKQIHESTVDIDNFDIMSLYEECEPHAIL